MQKYIGIIIAIFITVHINSQESIITGQVTAFKTIALNNIIVLSKSTGNKTITDKNGNFSIKCSSEDVLIFDSECFNRTRRKIKNDKERLHINLYFNSTSKNRKIAVENNYLIKDSLEYALSNLPNVKEDYSVYSDIYTLIKAKFPYVQIIGTQITIPPPAFGTGAVLITIDGNQVSDISYVQPRNVISIQVLRGTETSMYGMKGANGVIIIKTFGKN